MKTTLSSFAPRAILRLLALLLALTGLPRLAPAGLTLELHVYHDASGMGYYCFPFLSTNNTGSDSTPITFDLAYSPLHTNGANSIRTNFSSTFPGGAGAWVIGDFNDFMQDMTNGLWTLILNVGDASQHTYSFTVSAANLDSNSLGNIVFTYPTNGAEDVTNQPTFTWQGPSGWDWLSVNDNTRTNGNDYQQAAQNLDPAQTSWPCPVALPDGTNTFHVDYTNNISAILVAHTPQDSLSNSLPGWLSTATAEVFDSSQFSVGAPPPAPTNSFSAHKLVAHYTFDTSYLGQDSSGNGNDINDGSSWGPPNAPYQQLTSDAVAGPGAAQFFGYSSLSAYYTDPTPTYGDLLVALSGSFSVSLWVNTTNLVGANDEDNPFQGAIVIYAYNDDSQADGVVPVAITGSKVAFYTGDAAGSGSTLHSISDVTNNNDHYIHVVVTRDQSTGQKIIYVNGALDATGAGSLDALHGDTNYFSIGGVAGSSYSGLLDDVQFYSGVLSGADVAYLFHNPGLAVPDASAGGLAAHYDFDEGAVAAADVSGNSNNLVLAGPLPGGNSPVISSTAVAGSGSVSFDGTGFISAPASLLPVLAGTFSISLWVQTTQGDGDTNSSDFLGDGVGIVAADVPGINNDLVPVGLTGGHIGFNTGNTANSQDDALYSSATVYDGSWHQVVVTRDQSTGAKQIFIDGALDSSGLSTTALLSDPQLLVIGAVADASNPDPASPKYTGYSGYAGLLDDLQIYDRVLSPGEVQYLFQNPGSTATNSASVPLPPVSVQLNLEIERSRQGDSSGDQYSLFPSVTVATPARLTTNSLQSPTGAFYWQDSAASSFGSSEGMGSLADVLNEVTNGLWKLSINQGDPSQQVFTFSVSVNGLTTNLLGPVTIISPADASVNVATNPAFAWTGPLGWSSIFAYASLVGGAFEGWQTLPATDTTWPSPPLLNYGTNQFQVSYGADDSSQFSFSTPTNQDSTPIATFTAGAGLNSTALSVFLVGPPPAPVQLIHVRQTNGVFQFQFLSQTGPIHTVQSRTNVALGPWQPRGDLRGDGTLQTVQIPATNGPAEFFQINTHY
jgi:hypothetical protein